MPSTARQWVLTIEFMSKVVCPVCGDELGSKGALTLHSKKVHGNDSIAKLLTEYGAMAPRPGGAWRTHRPLSAAPSGVPSIDYAIGIGGVPRGTIIEIFGPAGVGKTSTALVFCAYAQQHGGLAGYIDAEHRFQPTHAKLIPGLDLDALYFAEPDGGEEALNWTKDYIKTGIMDVWVVDSVHGCVPKALRDKPIGSATMAELAKLMSAGCQVLEPIVAGTNTVLIFVNHVKSVPGVAYGKDWSKPGGSAMDYYPSIQLRVWPTAVYMNTDGRRIGHALKVKVENSKVSAPYATAAYDIFYMDGTIQKSSTGKHDRGGDEVYAGIDLGSCWMSVCEEEGYIVKDTASRWVDTETGESYGYRRDVIAMLDMEDSELRKKAQERVYGEYGSGTKAETAVAVT